MRYIEFYFLCHRDHQMSPLTNKGKHAFLDNYNIKGVLVVVEIHEGKEEEFEGVVYHLISMKNLGA